MASVSKKRLRIFAGPNGSGKTTITQIVESYVKLGVYVNADELKVLLANHRCVDFSQYGLQLDSNKFLSAFKNSSLSTRLKSVEDTLLYLSFNGNKLVLADSYIIEDYFVSFIASFIWKELLDCSSKFTIETVMSHPSKLDFIRLARKKGFKVYLYFVSLADPELNQHRVKTRVKFGGHSVDSQKICQRYYRTMHNLYEALKMVDTAYIFDNSAGEPKMIAVKKNGVLSVESNYIPKWFKTYVIEVIEKKDQ